MKDKAINSLAKASSKSKLAREGANSSRNKRGVGRRSNYSGGLSSSRGSRQFNAGRSIANSISSSGSQELSEKQQKQQQRLNRAIKVAEKIPFLNKYAKIAKAAQKVTEMKGKGGKILGGMSGGKPASGEEAEDMLAAEQRGEEYKPDQTEKKFTVFSKRQLIISAVLICSGIFIILILIAVITMSSITDTAGEAYLASKDTPTEEELAEAYGAQDAESSSSSSSSSETSGNPASSNSSFDSLLSKGGTSVSELNQKKIEQLVVVESSGSSANVSFYEIANNNWKVDSSLNASGYVGSNGTTSSPSEGKSATPKGLYGVGDAFYQGSKPNTKLDSFQITSNTYWIDDPDSKYYNQRVEGTSNKDWSSAEHMSEISSYKYGFVINYNMSPVKKGAGSAIFFHISHNSPTAGCVSVSEDKVLSYLAKLDKSKNPYILII